MNLFNPWINSGTGIQPLVDFSLFRTASLALVLLFLEGSMKQKFIHSLPFSGTHLRENPKKFKTSSGLLRLTIFVFSLLIVSPNLPSSSVSIQSVNLFVWNFAITTSRVAQRNLTATKNLYKSTYGKFVER